MVSRLNICHEGVAMATSAVGVGTDRPRRILRIGAIAVAIAAVANVVVALVATAADVAMQSKPPGGDVREDISIAAFALATIVAGGLGILLARILASRGTPGRTWAIITGALTVVSMLGPIGADATTGTKVTLAIAHVVAAVIIIPVLARELDR
jgi:hypothetical protein